MRKIITSLIAILVVTNLEAQQRTPKLVVCITVDQLRGDYIEYFYNTFGERGFKRLMNEGLVYNNIRFEFSTSMLCLFSLTSKKEQYRDQLKTHTEVWP